MGSEMCIRDRHRRVLADARKTEGVYGLQAVMSWANGTDGQHHRRLGCSGAVVSYSLDNKVAQDRQNEDIWLDPKMSNGSGDTINTYYR